MSSEEKVKLESLSKTKDNLEFTRYISNIKNFNLSRFEELKKYGEELGLIYLNFPSSN